MNEQEDEEFRLLATELDNGASVIYICKLIFWMHN